MTVDVGTNEQYVSHCLSETYQIVELGFSPLVAQSLPNHRPIRSVVAHRIVASAPSLLLTYHAKVSDNRLNVEYVSNNGEERS